MDFFPLCDPERELQKNGRFYPVIKKCLFQKMNPVSFIEWRTCLVCLQMQSSLVASAWQREKSVS